MRLSDQFKKAIPTFVNFTSKFLFASLKLEVFANKYVQSSLQQQMILINVLVQIFRQILGTLSYYHTKFFNRFVLYPLLAYLPENFDIRFLNYGYCPDSTSAPGLELWDESMELACETVERHFSTLQEVSKIISSDCLEYKIECDALRAHCFLYEKTLSLAPNYASSAGVGMFLNGASVLDIGCGFGGGIEWIKK